MASPSPVAPRLRTTRADSVALPRRGRWATRCVPVLLLLGWLSAMLGVRLAGRRRVRDEYNNNQPQPPNHPNLLPANQPQDAHVLRDASFAQSERLIAMWRQGQLCDVEVRAERRHRELQAAGDTITLAELTAQLRERDARDRSRKDAPMIAAADAVLIDTTDLTIDAAVEKARAAVEAVLARQE